MAKPKKIERKPVKVADKVKPEKEKKLPDTAEYKDEDELEDESDEYKSEDSDDKEEPPAKLKSSSAKEEYKDEDADPDYLRQYQYRMVNNTPTIGGVLTDPEPGSKAERMKAFLLGQRRINMLVPLPEGSSSKVPFSVTRNGYRLDFPTNTYIEVPEAIAEMIVNSNKNTALALNRDRIGAGSEQESALS